MLDALYSAFTSPLWVVVTGVATMLGYLAVGGRVLRRAARGQRHVGQPASISVRHVVIGLLGLVIYGWLFLGTVMTFDFMWVHPEPSYRWVDGGPVYEYLPRSTRIPASATLIIIHAAFWERATNWIRETRKAGRGGGGRQEAG